MHLVQSLGLGIKIAVALELSPVEFVGTGIDGFLGVDRGFYFIE